MAVYFRIVVQISANPPPRFTWYRNMKQLKPSQRFKVSYEQGIITLIIFNIQTQDSGDYMLRAQNELGDCTWKTTLNIKCEPLLQFFTFTSLSS